MTFFKMIEHLLPTGQAWHLTIDKMLRKFLLGFETLGSDVKDYFDLIYLDLLPRTTRQLDLWEKQFDIRETGLSEQARRDRLDATWKALGGQDLSYLEDTLRNAGFDVFIHEWFEPGTDPPVARDPTLVIRRFAFETTFLTELGDTLSQAGEVVMQLGNSLDPQGYPLVNKFFPTEKDLISDCGVATMECGEALALCGSYEQLIIRQKEYFVEDNPAQFPFYIYVGGPVFGDIAEVAANRRDELERLVLKHFAGQLWVGMLVKYS